MDREAIDTRLERIILALVLGALAFGPLAFGGVRPSEFVVLQWLVVGALVVWLVRLWVAPRFRFLLPPSAWAIFPFVAYAAWRYRTADIEYVARQEFIQVALAAVLFLVLVNNLYSQDAVRVITICLVTLGTLIAMYGIYQWLTGSQSVWLLVRPAYEGRGSGTYVCPNHLAGFLEMICPLAITFTVLRGFGPVPRILFGYASFVMLVGIALTASRGGWLSTAVGMAVLAVVLIQKKTHFWAALVVLMLVGGTGVWLYSRVLAPRVASPTHRSTDDIRFRLWDSAKQMWKEHPWIGVGPDHFDYRYRGFRPAHWASQMRPGRAHNDYWNTLADWGVIGLVLVLLPVAVAGVGIIFSWRYLQRSGETTGSRISVVLGSAIGIVSLLVHSFLDFNMHIPANAFLAVTLLALITAHWRFASQRFWLTARWPVRVGATLLLAGTGFYLGAQALQHTAETLALKRADAAQPASQEKIAALQKAFQIDPKNADTASEIGEQLRLRSWAGQDVYRTLALEALEWFQRAGDLNRWDPQARIRAGMCLDWLGRHAEAETFFTKALQLDPNNRLTRAMMGWHCFQEEKFAETCHWMENVLIDLDGHNEMAAAYLDLAKKAMAEQSNTNRSHRLP